MPSGTDLNSSFTKSTSLLAKPWRRVRLSRLFVQRLLTAWKTRKAASATSDYVSLPSDESNDYQINICEDEEKCHAAVPRAHTEHDVNAPMLDRLLKPALTSPPHEAPSRQAPVKEQAEDIGGSEFAVHIDPGYEEEENSEILDNVAVIGSVRDDDIELCRDYIRLMVKKRRPSFLKRYGGIEKVASLFNTHLETGINSPNGQDLPDTNPTTPTPPVRTGDYFYFLLEACSSYTVMLLVIAAILSFLTDSIGHGFTHGWYDGTAIVVATLLLVTVPSAAKFHRAKKHEKELLGTTNSRVKVRRGGQDQSLEISRVVEGDLVTLGKGVIVPADGLFVRGSDLELDDALSPKIGRDHNPFLYRGSRVTSGSGNMLVISTVARNAPSVKEPSRPDPTRPSLLEDHINKPHDYMEVLPLLLSLLVLFQALLQVLHHKHGVKRDVPDLKGDVSVKQVVSLFTEMLLFPRGTIPVLTSSLAVLVIALQHGVPLTIGLTLVYWNPESVSAKVNSLWASLIMGRTTVLYVNTTSARFCDEMEVNEFWMGEGKIERDSEIPEPVLDSLYQAIEVSSCVPEISASPRNSVLIPWANSNWGLTDKFRNKKYTILDFKQLRPDKKVRGTLIRAEVFADEERKLYSHSKGPASPILEMCSHYINQEGIRCFLEERKEMFKQVIKDMEEKGLVTIAFASWETNVQEIVESGLNLLAIVGLKPKITESTKSAVAGLRRAGICIVLGSEVEPLMLTSVACELKVKEVRELGEQEAMEEILVMEGLKPQDNHNIVSSLKEKGEVVAFFGGSTDDVFTMKEADLRITDSDMSTQMAKKSADIVLDEGIDSLGKILENGRCAYRNIQVFTQLQLSTWISWSVLTLVLTICSGDSLTTPLQQIWMSTITCFLGALMMRMQLRIPGLIVQKPAPRTETFIKKAMWIQIAIQVSCQSLVFLLFQFNGQHIFRVSNGVHSTMMFTSFILCQVLDRVEATKTGTMKELAKVLCQHYWFLLTVVAIVAVQVMIVQIGQSLADGVQLNGALWMQSCGIAVLPMVVRRSGAFLLSRMSYKYLLMLSKQSFSMFIIPFSMILFVSAAQVIQPMGVRSFSPWVLGRSVSEQQCLLNLS